MAAIPPSIAALFGADERSTRLPENLAASLFIAMVYRRLGGQGRLGVDAPGRPAFCLACGRWCDVTFLAAGNGIGNKPCGSMQAMVTMGSSFPSR